MSGGRLGSLLLGLLLLINTPALGQTELPIDWQSVLTATVGSADPGERVQLLSARFLGTPYVANTLVGSATTPEQLTVALDAVDCFTLLDYVEALRRSTAPGEFRQHLIGVRYRGGQIAWETRRHFFTDWVAAADGWVIDVTAEIGRSSTRQVAKQLNRKADGSGYLPGVAVQERIVRFLPATALDASTLERLRPGDYLGIYSPEPGLDVTHVGIVVRTTGCLALRHASSSRSERRVVDSDLGSYLAGKPGIVVLRPQALPAR